MAQTFFKSPWATKENEDSKASMDQQEGESLTTILRSQEDRSALTLLIMECTESMRQRLLDIFDASQTGKQEDLLADPEAEIVDTRSQAEADQDVARRAKELSTPNMQDLQEAALKSFDEWRFSVIDRVGEIVNARDRPSSKESNPPTEKSDERVTSSRLPAPPSYDEDTQEVLRKLYPPVDSSLKHLSGERKALIVQSLLLLLLSLQHYHSQSRLLLLFVSSSLDLPINFLALSESKVAQGLLITAENLQADEETKKRAEGSANSRKWKVGLAAVAGAAIIGVTGGLAAPLLAAGIGTAMGGLGLGATATAGYLGTLAGSSVLMGGLFGAYGARMTGRAMEKYAHEVSDFAFLPTRARKRSHKIETELTRLRVSIGIGGWLTSPDDVIKPWKVIGVQLESFALQWELEALLNLGNSLTAIIKSAAWTLAKKEIISRTIFASLAAGLWPLALLKVSRILDNPFSVANTRAQKAGEILADALANKVQGERPVTLIGYGLGAKVIFSCLKCLAQKREFGLVESAVFIGTPASSAAAEWRLVRSVVANRVVNVFNTNDYILAFLYRSHSIQYGIAGLQAIRNVQGVENFDATELVSGPGNYSLLTGTILQAIDFEDLDPQELAVEKRELREQEAKEKSEAAEQASDATGEISEHEVQDLEKEVAKRNEQSYVRWMQRKMLSAGTSVSSAYDKATSSWKKHETDGSPLSEEVKKAQSETLFENESEASNTEILSQT